MVKVIHESAGPCQVKADPKKEGVRCEAGACKVQARGFGKSEMFVEKGAPLTMTVTG